MNPGQLAALIAAVAFAVGVCAAVYALLKLARLTTVATRYLTGMQHSTDTLIAQAQTAIDRTNEQLTRTEAVTANVNEVTANVAEMTENLSALAAIGRAFAAGPVGKAAAFSYGVRRAVSLRRAGSRPPVLAASIPPPRAEIGPGPQPAPPPAESAVRGRIIGWALNKTALSKTAPSKAAR